jgi:hypothetical protein
MTVLTDTGEEGRGYLFYTQQKAAGMTVSNGPVIMDDRGRPVWFLPLASGVAADFRVQTYQGKPVLTWAQGQAFQDPTAGHGVDYIYDTSYHLVATVQAGNGMNSDLHEFLLTPDGTALITIYHLVTVDLTPWGGPKNGNVLEGVAQEIDVATGAVLFEWHSLDHVGFDESNFAVPKTTATYDYFHINSVNLDADGNFLISARHTSTVYKVHRTTGAVIWRLGGTKSDFTLGPGLPFGWQHDAVAVDASTIRLFDNESNGTPPRILWIKHDDVAMTATIDREIVHPAGLATAAEGSAQELPNGDTVVGWGALGGCSEFDADGNLVLDMRQAKGLNNYRTYRFEWEGQPDTVPTLRAIQNDDGTITVHAIWNGATNVASWQIVGSGAGGSGSVVQTVPWNGLDSVATITGPFTSLQIVALDAQGATLATSAVSNAPFLPPPPVFAEQPSGQTIALGSTVVFRAPADDGATYRWSLNGVPLADGASGRAAISGSSQPTLVVRNAGLANGGSYTCAATNAGGTTRSSAATLVVSSSADPGRLVNLSCRAQVSAGDNALIVGFVVGGNGASGSPSVLIRASGPALGQFGVADTLADPLLAVFNMSSSSRPFASDEAWDGDASVVAAAEMVHAFPWPDATSRDTAVLRSLAPGLYTCTVTSASNDAGVAMAEAYNTTSITANTSTTPRFINGSGRAFVGTGDDLLVSGFVIGGSTARTVLIRASGPTLSAFGVHGALPDPQIELYSSAGKLLATDTSWNGDPQIAAMANAVGAFGWADPSSKDSALLITLPPGGYTAQVRGNSDDTGVALVEVYEVP